MERGDLVPMAGEPEVRFPALVKVFQQPWVGVGSQEEVNEGGAAANLLLQKLGDATCDDDGTSRIQLLVPLQSAQIGEELLLRLLSHRAGVDDEEGSGTLGIDLSPATAFQKAGHLFRVVDVHLTTVSLNKEAGIHLSPRRPLSLKGLLLSTPFPTVPGLRAVKGLRERSHFEVALGGQSGELLAGDSLPAFRRVLFLL